MISILGITGISNGQEYVHPSCTQNPECTAPWESRTATGNAVFFDELCKWCTFTVEYRIREGCSSCEISIDKITYKNPCPCTAPNAPHKFGRIIEAAIFVAISDPSRPQKCKPIEGPPSDPNSCVENLSVGISSCWKIGQPSGIPDFSVGYSCASAETCCFAKYKVCHYAGGVVRVTLVEKTEVTCSADPNDPNAPWMFGCDYSPCPNFPYSEPQP